MTGVGALDCSAPQRILTHICVPTLATVYSIGLKVNKHTSFDTLSSIDYPFLAMCFKSHQDHRVQPSSVWKRSMEALHADAFFTDASIPIYMKQDAYCQPRCTVAMSELSEAQQTQLLQYGQNYWVDDLPVALRLEDDESVTTRYWPAIPLATAGGVQQQQGWGENSRYRNTTANQVFVYNHFNFVIYYQPADAADQQTHYRVLRTVVEPFSIKTSPSLQVNTAVASCGPTAVTTARQHTSFEMLDEVPPQLAQGTVMFTYDVIWRLSEDEYKSRWDVFLTMDHAQPFVVHFLGVFVSILICCILLGALITWVLRDLSYKPIMLQDDDDEEEEEQVSAPTELQIWPLSPDVFLPPRVSPMLFAVACGTGAHLVTSSFLFVTLFRTGIISQSLWANLLTAAIFLYTIFSVVGGYVTGRLVRIFHLTRDDALKAALLTATGYPALGILVLFLVYDVFPASYSPNYAVVKNSLPVMVVWIFGAVPLTLAGGWWGHRSGPLPDFPVPSTGYNDMDLMRQQEEEEEKKQDGTENDDTDEERPPASLTQQQAKEHLPQSRGQCRYILLLLLIGGVLPVLGVFVSYAYGVAGPILVGYYTDNSSFWIASYTLFLASSAAVSLLLYYRQLRAQRYSWWWASFASAGSSGLYLFVLSMSWLIFNISFGDITGGVWALYVLWFAFTSLGAVLMTGFTGVAATLWFTRRLYSFTKRRYDD